jgi:hypothetical protein
MKIKFGFRESLLYPSLFVLFLAIRRLIKYILELLLLEIKLSYILVSTLFISEIVIGSIYLLIRYKKNNFHIESEFMGIPLFTKDKYLKRPDSNFKVIILIIFAAYFEIVGSMSRRYLSNDSSNELYDEYHARYRSSEIIIASIICAFTLKMKIYKHQIFSLIIILICLLVIFITELLCKVENLLFCIIILISSTCRVFLDVIEKYLFEVDFVDIYKITVFEGSIDAIFMSSLYFFNKPREELMNFIENKPQREPIFYWMGILFLVAYGILSAFKDINRRYTIKLYSPMTRALAESILDPFFIIYGYFQSPINDESKKISKFISFIITLICSFIMVFCSCIYNEIFVLYCFGLEKNTHLYLLNSDVDIDEDDKNLCSEDDD